MCYHLFMHFEFNMTDSPTIEKSGSKFVRILKALMLVKQLNQEQLAQILGCRQSQISNLLNGKSLPSYHTLQQLKNKFDIAIDHFLNEFLGRESFTPQNGNYRGPAVIPGPSSLSASCFVG